jgi:hypothetical protein
MVEASDIHAMRGLLIFSLTTFVLGGIIGWFCKATLRSMLTGLGLCLPATLCVLLGTLIFAPPDPVPPGGHSIHYYMQACVYLVIPYFIFFLPPSFLGALGSMFTHWRLQPHLRSKRSGAQKTAVKPD